jgi:hypothetical protein
MKFIIADDATADMIEHEAHKQGKTKAEMLNYIMGVYWLERSQYINRETKTLQVLDR